jgi:hypothetical protein
MASKDLGVAERLRVQQRELDEKERGLGLAGFVDGLAPAGRRRLPGR